MCPNDTVGDPVLIQGVRAFCETKEQRILALKRKIVFHTPKLLTAISVAYEIEFDYSMEVSDN